MCSGSLKAVIPLMFQDGGTGWFPQPYIQAAQAAIKCGISHGWPTALLLPGLPEVVSLRQGIHPPIYSARILCQATQTLPRATIKVLRLLTIRLLTISVPKSG